MNIDNAKRKFQNDPLFHALVESMVAGMEVLKFSPGELREAAVFAEILFERRHFRGIMVPYAPEERNPSGGAERGETHGD